MPTGVAEVGEAQGGCASAPVTQSCWIPELPPPMPWGPYSTDWLSAKLWALPHCSVLLPEDGHLHRLTATIQRHSSWKRLLNPQSMGSVGLSPRREGHPLLGPWLGPWPASLSEQVTPSDTLSPKMSYTVSRLYPWVLLLWISPTTDQRYSRKKNPESSSKQNLNLLCTNNNH